MCSEVRVLSVALASAAMLMGVFIATGAGAGRSGPSIFEFAFSTIGQSVWGAGFVFSGLAILAGHALGHWLYTAHWLAFFVFLAWGALLLLAVPLPGVQTTGYPLLCLLAAMVARLCALASPRRGRE